MTEHKLYEPLQSAQGTAPRTALMKIQNAILLNLDEKRGVVLDLLDLSTAFRNHRF